MQNKVKINGVEYTPFEANKNAIELGIDLSRRFIVVNSYNLSKNYFQNGDIIEFEREVESGELGNYFKNENKSNSYMWWKELAYYDEPSSATQPIKFKVGDRVRILKDNLDCADIKVGEIYTVSCVNDDNISIKKDNYIWGISEANYNYLELIEPLKNPSPLRDTIITDIKDEAQHKRVQEKLFEMGIKWYDGVCGPKFKGDKSDDLVVEGVGYNLMHNPIEEQRETFKKIPASEFLGEKEESKKFVSAASSLPDFDDEKIKAYRKVLGIFSNNNNKPEADPRVVKGNNKIMSNIVSFFNDLTVSAEDKELRKAGLKDSQFNWTYEAREIILNLEAKERGYKSYEEMAEKSGKQYGEMDNLSVLEVEALFTKFSDKLLKTATDFNKREEKKK